MTVKKKKRNIPSRTNYHFCGVCLTRIHSGEPDVVMLDFRSAELRGQTVQQLHSHHFRSDLLSRIIQEWLTR